MIQMTRRNLIKLVGASLPVVGFGAMVRKAETQSSVGKAVDLLKHQPKRITSQDKKLVVELVAKMADLEIGGQRVTLRTYDGRIPGHTWVANPGDTLEIRLRNDFPPDSKIHSSDPNIPHGFNVTNLHTHGLNVSPEDNQDNILLEIEPGKTLNYEIKIPDDHPTGTFWYHPHKHGSAALQLGSGMAGLLLIEGPGELSKMPEMAAVKEVDIVLQELFLNAKGEVPDDYIERGLQFNQQMFTSEVGQHWVANGQSVFKGQRLFDSNGQWLLPHQRKTKPIPPEIRMRPGEVQRWRIAHAGVLQTFEETLLEGHDLHILAYDGITNERIDTICCYRDFTSGNRLDVLIKASRRPGKYPFIYRSPHFGDTTFFNLVVDGTSNDMPLPAGALNWPKERLPYITDDEIVFKRTVNFSMKGGVKFKDPDKGPVKGNLKEDTREFFINGHKFSKERIEYTMKLGTAEEWTIKNDPLEAHPFHIHTNWIQVMEIADRFGNVVKPNDSRGRWQDNITVPAGGHVKIRHRFEKFTGKLPFHCHILTHEDEGMMALVEIVS